MKITTFASAILLGSLLVQPTFANDFEKNFEKNLANMSPAEKAPLVNFIIKMADDEVQKKYRNDPDVEQASLQLQNHNTLVFNIKIKSDERVQKLNQSPEAMNVVRNLIDKDMNKNFCFKNEKNKSIFHALGITHTQVNLSIGDIPLSNKRTEITSCQK